MASSQGLTGSLSVSVVLAWISILIQDQDLCLICHLIGVRRVHQAQQIGQSRASWSWTKIIKLF